MVGMYQQGENAKLREVFWLNGEKAKEVDSEAVPCWLVRWRNKKMTPRAVGTCSFKENIWQFIRYPHLSVHKMRNVTKGIPQPQHHIIKCINAEKFRIHYYSLAISVLPL